MGEEYSVAELSRQLTDLRVQVGKLDATQTINHQQNRGSIHELRNGQETLVGLVTTIRLQIARWSVGAGIMTAVALKAIDHFIK